jgi:hypothetical protein
MDAKEFLKQKAVVKQDKGLFGVDVITVVSLENAFDAVEMAEKNAIIEFCGVNYKQLSNQKTGIELLNDYMYTPVRALRALLCPNDKLEDVKIIDPMDLHKIAEKIDAIIEQNKRLTKWINDLNDNKHYHLWANMTDIEQKLSKENVERLGRV